MNTRSISCTCINTRRKHKLWKTYNLHVIVLAGTACYKHAYRGSPHLLDHLCVDVVAGEAELGDLFGEQLDARRRVAKDDGLKQRGEP